MIFYLRIIKQISSLFVLKIIGYYKPYKLFEIIINYYIYNYIYILMKVTFSSFWDLYSILINTLLHFRYFYVIISI